MVFGSKFGSGLFQIHQTSASNLSDNHYLEIARNSPFIWCRVMLATQDKHNLGCQRVAWLQSQSSTGYYWERAVKVTWLTSLLYNTTQDFSCLVPLIIFIWEAFGNSRMFPDLKQAGKKPVPNAGTKLGPERGCSQMLGTGNFPEFFGKNLVPGKWHLGTQTSIW